MVNLDSPLLTLGALYLAGSRYSDFTGGEGGKGLVLGGFGAENGEYLGNKLTELTGTSGSLDADLAQALAGAVVSYGGRRFEMGSITNPVARGVMYDVAGSSMAEAGLSLSSMAGNGGSSAPRVSRAPRSSGRSSPPMNGSQTTGKVL